jgi:hypothetical protein
MRALLHGASNAYLDKDALWNLSSMLFNIKPIH